MKIELKGIDNIDNLSDEYFILQLGIGLQYEYSPKGVKYSAPYMEMGRELWNSFNFEIYQIICKSDSKGPKEWINDLIIGDIRNLATGIISSITATYNVSIAIVLPVAALILKTGILKYCSTEPNRSEKSVEEILISKKTNFSKGGKKKKVKKKGTNIISKKLTERKNNSRKNELGGGG